MNRGPRRWASLAAAALLAALAIAAIAGAFASSPSRRPSPHSGRAATRRVIKPTRLTATVDAQGAVRVTGADGQAVRRLPSGQYSLLIIVESSAAGFTLSGPNVRRSTPARFTGAAIWGLLLRTGIYRYGSRQPHAATHVIYVQ